MHGVQFLLSGYTYIRAKLARSVPYGYTLHTLLFCVERLNAPGTALHRCAATAIHTIFLAILLAWSQFSPRKTFAVLCVS